MTLHIDPQMSKAFLRGILPEEQAIAVQKHVEECASCWEELETTRLVLGAVRNLKAPSQDILDRVTAAFQHKRRRRSTPRAVTAVPAYDSWSQVPALGLRGTVGGRQLLYHQDAFDLDIQLTFDNDSAAYTVRGQLLSDASAGLPDANEGLPVLLRNKDNAYTHRALTDKFGRFVFSRLQSADYEMVVQLDEEDLLIRLDPFV